MEESARGTEQGSKYVAAQDAINPRREGCAEGIEQRPNHAVLKNAEIKFKVEECA